MEDLANQLNVHVNELASRIGQLQEKMKGTPVSRRLHESLQRFHAQYESYCEALSSGNLNQVLQYAKNVSVYAVTTSQHVGKIQGLDDEARTLARSIGSVGSELRRKVDDDPSTYLPLGEMPSLQTVSLPALPNAAVQQLRQLVLEQEKQDERVKNRLADNDRRLAAFAESLGRMEGEARETLAKIVEEYQRVIGDLESKQKQIDDILGHASGRVIAGDYERSASSEKAAADWLRGGSLICMAAIVGMLGYSFWETVKQDFDWHTSLFRVILAFLISAPAAYLARESTKHRAQQYTHLQAALDLKAIAPYLASLPDEIQHRIKSEVAGKLFAGRDLSHVASESYPINAQEILMKLVDMVGTKGDSYDKGKKKGDPSA